MAAGNGSSKVAVLGGGPGGYAAAFRAADLGLDVTVVDPEENPGGVCLYRGCIPSKALLHVAKVVREATDAAQWGVRFERPQVDLERLRGWTSDVVAKLTSGLGALCKAKGVRFVRGRGVFVGPHALRIDDAGSAGTRLEFDYAVIATGSRPVSLPGVPDCARVMTSTDALELEEVPDSLLVVGGGYIGLEIGSVYAALGTRVTVVEMTDALLPGVDADLVRVLSRDLEARFASIRTGTRVTAMKEDGEAIVVDLATAQGAVGERFSRVLVAVGRRPNTSGLGLAETGVELDDAGFIAVDAARRTATPHIFAIGDVTGQPMLAHKATHEGTTAAEAIAGRAAAFAPLAIPAVVFTDPEIAWCGLTQSDARAAGLDAAVARFPWQASGRALTLGRPAGLTKLVIDKETERVLGAGIVGPGAGDLIAEVALAVEMGAVAEDLAATVHAHPTLSETVMEAAEVFRGLSVHLHRKR